MRSREGDEQKREERQQRERDADDDAVAREPERVLAGRKQEVRGHERRKLVVRVRAEADRRAVPPARLVTRVGERLGAL